MKPAGLKAFKLLIEKPHLIYDNRADGNPVVPDDLMIAFSSNKTAYNNFMKFTQSSQRIYIDWLNSAKRPETRLRRIDKIIELSTKNIRPGMM